MAHDQSPGWYVISLRPQGEHDALRLAARERGGGLLALSPWRIAWLEGADTHLALSRALLADRVLFTSPHAVRAAAALQPLRRKAGQTLIAVGSGTADALQQAGMEPVESPARMDSEGVLALPALQEISGLGVSLVTAPDGRQVLAPELRARGARVVQANVYTRQPIPLQDDALHRLRSLEVPAVIALSSGGALTRVLEALPADLSPSFRRLPVVAASARLLELAKQAGFDELTLAEGPLPTQLAAAIAGRFR